jgi:hypothetical protein
MNASLGQHRKEYAMVEVVGVENRPLRPPKDLQTSVSKANSSGQSKPELPRWFASDAPLTSSASNRVIRKYFIVHGQASRLPGIESE